MQPLLEPSPSAIRPAGPAPPIILIEDWTQEPPITTSYTCGDNILSFNPIYSSIKSLITHPECTHRPSQDAWPCLACSTAFVDPYWNSAARLLDYFADFYALDTPLMQSIWFHLLDVWQEGALWLPYEAVLEASSVSPESVQHFSKAWWFRQDFEDTLDLFSTTIFGAKSREESRVHPPTGEKSSPAGEYSTGPWVSGLTGWEQFLSEGAPGVAAPLATLETESEEGHKGEEEARDVRYIPMSAIGIIHKHTSRARQLAATMDHVPKFLDAFDQHCLRFPTATSGTHTYASLTGHTVSYALVNGAPPITRYVGYGDPNMLLSKPKVPDFTLLDECVGSCKGVEAYAAVSGEQAEEEEEDGDEDEATENIGVREEAFDLWRVCDMGKAEDLEEVLGGLGEMFDEWSVELDI
jgi:hypothetical protein